jgi:hypothetical protein
MKEGARKINGAIEQVNGAKAIQLCSYPELVAIKIVVALAHFHR